MTPLYLPPQSLYSGWSFDAEGYLVDPAGNRYTPQDIQAAFWASQAWKARAGSQGEIRYLYSQLREDLLRVRRPILLTASRIHPQGVESLGSVILSPWRSFPHVISLAGGEGGSSPIPYPQAMAMAIASA